MKISSKCASPVVDITHQFSAERGKNPEFSPFVVPGMGVIVILKENE